MINASLPISFHVGNYIFLSRKPMGNFVVTIGFCGCGGWMEGCETAYNGYT